MKKKVLHVLRCMLFVMYYLYSSVAITVVYELEHKNGELNYLLPNDYHVWKKSMLRMLKEYCFAGYNFRIRQTIYAFAKSKIEVIRKREFANKNNPIVVLCIKNDLQRIQMLVEHYRSLGVERFAFMDNGSDDGTYEWLLKQTDIDLYRCFDHYKTAVKEGWINRIISYYGFNRWYVVTDSDELLVYYGMEECPLTELIAKLEKRQIKRIKGLTLDTYTDSRLFGRSDNIRKDYRWIDTDSYQEIDAVAGKEKIKRYIGGPRYRLMNSTITLSKYPLVYWKKGTISDSAHFQYPHDVIKQSPCIAGILHYKFIDRDLDEFEKRAKKESGFSTGGKIYKQYMDIIKKQTNLTFMYEGSIEFTDSKALNSISIIGTINE